jgi:hypothetical protein
MAISYSSERDTISELSELQDPSLSLICFIWANILPALAASFQKSGAWESASLSAIVFSSDSGSKTPPYIDDFGP